MWRHNGQRRFVKAYIVGEVRGSNPADSHYILHNNNNPTNEGHVVPMDWATCPHTICHQQDTCRSMIRQHQPTISCHITINTSSYGLYGPATSPYGLYGQVQSASKNFACLAWRTDRDIFSIRTPFEKVNIPPESGRRDGRNGTVFVAFRAL
jgi:hypothetical protein